VRAEVRFTRDVDLVVCVNDDADAEGLVSTARSGYSPLASVEQSTRHRLATVRLLAPQKVKADLLFLAIGL
jgi:hypothetical protein